ncbi:hypothetical protein BS47DRAFT_1334516, partial [Hydnum rufescens UP504]
MSDHSQELNYLFNFSVIGVSEGFSDYQGGSYWLAMSGRTYHRMFPTERPEHPTHWFLYDPAGQARAAQNHHVPISMVDAVRLDIQQYNPLLRSYTNFTMFHPAVEHAYIELTDAAPAASEIAALYHIGNAPRPNARQLFVQRAADTTPTKVPILHPLYEPLQYPLLFPHATCGWGSNMRKQFTQRAYYKVRLLTEPRFSALGRLGCEWSCDMYSRVEDEVLEFIKKGKHAESDRFRNDETNEDDDGDDDSFTLPASFTGSPKYYSDKVADTLALTRQKGKPDLMITVMCNPNWQEIRAQLRLGQSAVEVSHITNRVFK